MSINYSNRVLFVKQQHLFAKKCLIRKVFLHRLQTNKHMQNRLDKKQLCAPDIITVMLPT